MSRVYTPDYVLAATARILTAILPLYERTPGQVANSSTYARYRRDVRALLSDTRAAARSLVLAETLASITRRYRTASTDPRAVIEGLERVVVAARAVQPITARSPILGRQRENEQALALLFEALALAEIGNAVSTLVPRSYDESAKLRARLGRAYDVAIERASDQGAIELLRALRDTQAKVVRDLIERGRTLARIVTYETMVPLPSLVLAHRFYQDASRADELLAENAGTDHPSFMPMKGRSYSR